MSQGRGLTGVIAAFAAFVVCLASAGVIVWQADDLAGRLAGGPPMTWSAGTPAADLAVLPASTAGAAPAPVADRVAATLQPLLADRALGTNVTAHVIDAATGQVLATRNSDSLTVPASTIKLVTAAAALSVLGPTHRFATRAVAGAAPGEVVLVGGGDPTLAGGATGAYPDAARLPDLAEQVKRALGGTAPTKLTFDAAIFVAPALGPWDSDIPTNGVVAAITGLMTDGGRADPKVRGQTRRVPEPDVTAAQAFAALLGLPAAAATRGTAPAGAKELGTVQSPPLVRLVEVMLTDSDNVIAEALARHVAIKRGQPASFTGGGAAQQAAIGELGLPAAELTLADGSGLARADKVSASLLAELVALSAKPDRVALRTVLTGLPVSAYNGTLATRFRKATAGASAAGVVRAKTGTLRSVSSIAGIVFTADGRQLAFAVLADNVPVGGTGPAQDALDRIVAALAACGCR
jgi:D-alanyl-D-alanine carboxypeptidase/D-alanyl-D-alanine-endopeptidase (penicillin-binding protein 4)